MIVSYFLRTFLTKNTAAEARRYLGIGGGESGEITESDLNFSDITTANSSTTQHGLLPKLSGNVGDVLRGNGTFGAGGGGGSGDVVGPASSVDNRIATFDGATGKLIQDSGALITAVPTQGENDALAGTNGTPSAANPYVTDSDPRNTNARTPSAHATSHQNGGTDEVNVGGLSGTLADPQTPSAHAASHQDGGADEISITGLTGLLATAQTPATHAASHQNGAADEINVAGLSGLLADDQNAVAEAGIDTSAIHNNVAGEIAAITLKATPVSGDFLVIEDSAAANAKKRITLGTLPGGAPSAHATSHQNGGGDEINVGGLNGVLADPQTPATHAATHSNASSDPITITALAGFPGGSANFLRADGTFNAPPDTTGITQLTTDVTAGPGSGSQAATIAANAVTYAKMQDVSAASRLLGRGSAAGAGDLQEITLGTNLSMSGTTLNASGGGGSANVGTASINFGAFPGASDTSLAITGQGAIAAGSVVQAWIRPEATAEHSADEHWVEAIKVIAGNIVAGVGFTIYGMTEDKTRRYGNWTVAWTWA